MKENEKIWAVKDGYLVNRDGSIYKLNWYKKNVLHKAKQRKNPDGYMVFSGGLVHRFIAECFIPNPNNLPEINHKDENKTNNCVDNLEWCDHKYNINYGTRNKRSSISNKGKHKTPVWMMGMVNGKLSHKGVLHTEETKKEIKLNQPTRKTVYQYTLNGEFVREWVSLREIQRVLGYDSGYISACCKGKHKKAYDSLWFFHRL